METHSASNREDAGSNPAASSIPDDFYAGRQIIIVHEPPWWCPMWGYRVYRRVRMWWTGMDHLPGDLYSGTISNYDPTTTDVAEPRHSRPGPGDVYLLRPRGEK